MRLIDADLVIKDLKESTKNYVYDHISFAAMINKIQSYPTVGRYGHWIDTGHTDASLNSEYRCSCCDAVDYMKTPYCWRCGARMDGISESRVIGNQKAL